MLDIWQKLSASGRPIVLYGMGNGAETIMKQLSNYGLAPSAFFASDDFVRGQSFKGMRVLTFAEAKEKFPDMVVLVAFGTQRAEVIENILSLDATVYAPEVPVVGEGVFTLDYARAHRAELEQVYSLLADEQSKVVFREIVEYRLDGEIRHLINSQTSADEMMALFGLGENESYLDLGAYNGDTVLDFAARTGAWRKITAVEPDKKNYNKLVNNTCALPNVLCLQNAVSARCETVGFASRGGRNSRLGGEIQVEAVSVDSLCEDFTFIKMDVEGQESAAIEGARKTILNRPKMLISAYHRTEDIFSIPLQVLKINPSYRVYLRHLPYIPAWDTNYCFV